MIPAPVRRTFSLTNFYDTPKPFPAGKPGALVRSEEFDEYDLPPGVLAKRILYRSRSASGQDVLSSGVVLYPDQTAPAGGWPVIAWAHDLTGVARACAPSLTRNLQHGPFLSMYAGLGYAVVAADYAGLGSDFRNAFSDMQSNALDVIYSVTAAHSAVQQLAPRWIAMGYGEGALAVIGVVENDVTHDENFLGSIAIALGSSQSPQKSALFFAYGIKTLFPDFDPKQILTDNAFALYPRIQKECAQPELAQKNTAMLKPDWQSNNAASQYLTRNVPGQKPAHAPLLVIASETDPAAPIRETERLISRLCDQRDEVQLEKYPDPDPGYIIGESVRDQMSWIQGRLAGRTAPSNCSRR